MAYALHKHRRLSWLLFGLFVLMALLHVASALVTRFSTNQTLLMLAPGFDLDAERNVSTVYNALLWLLAGLICFAFITKSKHRRDSLRWGVIGLFLSYVALDEVFVWHERLAEPIRKVLQISDTNPLYHAWVLLAFGAVLGVGLMMYLIRDQGPHSHLQKQILVIIAMVAAAIIFLEIIGTQLYFSSPLSYKLGPVMIEELLEIGFASFALHRLAKAFPKNKTQTKKFNSGYNKPVVRHP